MIHNPKLLSNESIEIEHCPKCGKYTLNHIIHNDIGKMVDYHCLGCA